MSAIMTPKLRLYQIRRFRRNSWILFGLFLLLLPDVSNSELFILLNNFFYQFSHTFWVHLTDLGNGAVIGTLALFFVIQQPQYTKRLFLSALLLAIVINALKQYYAFPRPPAVLGPDEIKVIGTAFTSRSFPSGHTATAFLAAGFIWLSFRWDWLRWTAFALACGVGLSRIATGVHWPQDVMLGALLGWMVAQLAASLSHRAWPDWANRLLLIVLSLAAIGVLFFEPSEFPDHPSVQWFRYLLGTGLIGVILYEMYHMSSDVGSFKTRLTTRVQWLVEYQNWLPLRFMKFGLVGFTGFLVDTLVYTIILNMGMTHLGARAASYWVSATTNWYLNRRFTFNDADREAKVRQWIKYLLMAVGSFILNWGSYYLLTEYVSFFATYKFIAFVVGIAMGMFFNFAVANWIIFRRKRKDWLS